MAFNINNLRHFYFNRYILSRITWKKYLLSYDYTHKAIWFRTYKVASRTLDKFFEDVCEKGDYVYGSSQDYLPWMFKKYFRFAFVRNPETRFVSAWKDKVLRQNYFEFDEARHEEMKNFDNFIGWVETLNINRCDEHIRCQNAKIDLNNIDFIGRFENLARDIKLLSQRLGIEDYEIEHRNQGIKKEVDLTPEQRQRIFKIYEKDFRLFYPSHVDEMTGA